MANYFIMNIKSTHFVKSLRNQDVPSFVLNYLCFEPTDPMFKGD